MKLTKALRRDKKIQKRKSGMQMDGRSIFEIEKIIRDKAIKAQREFKEQAYQNILLGFERRIGNED